LTRIVLLILQIFSIARANIVHSSIRICCRGNVFTEPFLRSSIFAD
jgi:hypothetical protein